MITLTPSSATRVAPRLAGLGLAWIPVLWILGACDIAPESIVASPPPIEAAVPTQGRAPRPDAQGPRGFVVWESNRSGAWRLWHADLEGRGAVQLTPDEPRRRHCCAHVSPDGERVAYLSLPAGRQRYFDESAVGELRLLVLDNSPSRLLAGSARTYFEHRAAVWVDDRTLHYIALDGGVRRLDVETGVETLVLQPTGDISRRWIVDASGRWAASGLARLAPVLSGRLGEEIPLPGCQPYFSLDGKLAFWTAGAGGPIDRFDLATGDAETILRRNDSRLPADRGYLYFPMLSRDGSLLAFAASNGRHDHFEADYDLLVAEVDEGTLEVLGRPWTVAPDPGVDRFPDVWREPLELGRRVGEAPFELALEAPSVGDWVWRLDDLEPATGESFRTTLAAPGRYAVAASLGERHADGVVIVTAPRPPIEFEDDWPVLRDGLLWSWSAASGASTTPLLGRGRASSGSEPMRAPLDLADRSFVAEDTAQRLLDGLQGTNQLGLELAFVAPRTPPRRLAAILSIGRDGSRENLLVGQRGNRLVIRMRVGSEREGPFTELDLGRLTPGRRLHLALAYSPGRLTVFRGGELAERRSDLRGHFFQWKTYPLVLGDRDRGKADWAGTLEAVALFDRPLTAREAQANAARLSEERP